jgi:hypothetical protein
MKSSLPPKSGMSEFAQSHLISSILLLFRNHEHLRPFVFHHQKRELRDTPSALLKEARCFSRGERILIQIALDFWSDSGNARISDIVEYLDDENVLAVIRAVLRIREMDLYVTLTEEGPCCD